MTSKTWTIFSIILGLSSWPHGLQPRPPSQ